MEGEYLDQLENALMSAALADITDGPQRKALRSRWLIGMYNAAAFGLKAYGINPGRLEWTHEGEGQRLMWTSPTGLSCHLARVYAQPNDTWAAVVVAGVKDQLLEAMCQAEWAVCRLTG